MMTMTQSSHQWLCGLSNLFLVGGVDCDLCFFFMSHTLDFKGKKTVGSRQYLLSNTINRMHVSRSEPLWVTREHGRLPDVVKAQVEHADAFQADTPTRMGRAAEPEGVNVGLDGLQLCKTYYDRKLCLTRQIFHFLTNSMMLSPLFQELCVMNSLCSRQNLFASHEHVIGVRPLLVFWIGHRVEWPHCQGKLVQDVEIGVISRR